MHTNTLSEEFREARMRRVRSWTYWISAVISTLIFLFFMSIMMTVPGVPASEKIWMLSVAGIALAIPLVVGIWRFSSTEAPAMVWPLGPIAGVVLLLELAECVLSVVHLAIRVYL